MSNRELLASAEPSGNQSYERMSEEINYYDDELNELAEEIRRGIDGLAKLDPDAKAERINELSERISRIKHVYHSFKVELRELPKDQLRYYEDKSKQHNNTISKLLNELNWAKTEVERGSLLAGARGAPGTDIEMSAKDMIHQASHVQDESEASLQRSKMLVANAAMVGTETASTLKQQTEQLKKISEDVDTVESNLKQADRLIRAFLRRMATDKLIMVVLCLIISAILAIIILSTVNDKTGGNAGPSDDEP